jgi:hypothetical protein
MKLNVFGEYGEFTVVVLKKTLFPNTLNEIQHLSLFQRIFDPTKIFFWSYNYFLKSMEW